MSPLGCGIGLLGVPSTFHFASQAPDERLVVANQIHASGVAIGSAPMPYRLDSIFLLVTSFPAASNRRSASVLSVNKRPRHAPVLSVQCFAADPTTSLPLPTSRSEIVIVISTGFGFTAGYVGPV